MFCSPLTLDLLNKLGLREQAAGFAGEERGDHPGQSSQMSQCDPERCEHLSNIFSHSLVIPGNVVIAGTVTRGGCFASLSGVNSAHRG